MSELEQTIEELEAEVLAELEEESAASAPKKNAAAAEKQGKLKGKTPGGEVEDGGAPVVDPEAKSSPTNVGHGSYLALLQVGLALPDLLPNLR